ncbi:glycosyltransferase family 39 protein [Blastopirellula sp. J2-11]|uniref:ArnT family glycosyltransferase n=1 Tax=Blastopirellula sp. J2-11 TaxID=2943192 RepID=UPI0021C5E6F6|nr:glycosyltransferase family 39 protein [Blastopirellula sp. J2-11]UUO04984.1 glycosyltransferase family 39 protein [Blastopirellula sp. J2-11]
MKQLKQLLMAHWVTIVIVLMLGVHCLLLGRIAVVNAPVYDEIAHLPSGLSHWRFGNFSLYRVNPPLMRMIASLPLLISAPAEDWNGYSEGAYARPEFAVGRRFLDKNGERSFWHFTIARWAQISVSALGGWICYCWAKALFGTSSGLLALALWCFDPNLLAWGATITPDAGAATFGVAAGYAFWRWLKSPTWANVAIAGLALGLAELTKSTWILLFALWPLIGLIWRFSNRNLEIPKPKLIQLGAILIGGLYLLNMGYGFEKSFQRLGDFEFISQTLGGPEANETPGNRFRGTLLAEIPVPVPANFLSGMDVQKYDFERGKSSYLRGETKKGGWWYYYLYAMAVKTPLGTIALFGLAIALAVSRADFRMSFSDAVVLLLPAVTVLILVSSQTGFNRYLRYVLPAYPFLFIFASSAAKAFELRLKSIAIPVAACAIVAVIGSLSVFPHSMSYFNLAAGGPTGGPRHLLDANIDWGQDLLELKKFLDRHPEARPIHLAYFGYATPGHAGIEFEEVPQYLESEIGLDVPKLEPGWYAVSVNHLYGYQHYENDKPAYTYFQRFELFAKAGYSIYIYKIDPEQAVVP